MLEWHELLIFQIIFWLLMFLVDCAGKAYDEIVKEHLKKEHQKREK